jgi:hypothetical protein
LSTPTAPTPLSRKLANAFIVLFLGYQVAMPLTYYLSDRVYDERFSWRMFSTVRLQECAITVTETAKDGSEKPVPVGTDLQIAWVNILQRLRPAVVAKYFERRCAASADTTKVALSARCQATDGSTLPAHGFAMSCADRELSESEAAK